MRGAVDSGLRTGVYFFSQAINVAEAIEEAEYVLERIAASLLRVTERRGGICGYLGGDNFILLMPLDAPLPPISNPFSELHFSCPSIR